MKLRFMLKVTAFAACALLSPLGLLAAEGSVATTDELLAVIADANAATETTVINLAAGTYAIPATSVPITLSGPVQLVGADAETTILTVEGGAAGANFLILNHADAKLECVSVSGVTVATGSTSNGPVHIKNGIVDSCVFTDNVGNIVCGVSLEGGKLLNSLVKSSSGGGSGVYGKSSAVIERCTITGITAARANYGSGLWIDGATARNCLIYNNAHPSNASNANAVFTQNKSVLEHCTIVKNTGAGLRTGSGRTIRNCIIWGNSTSDIVLSDEKGIDNNILQSVKGTNAFVVDPLFVGFDNNDFTLQQKSPAVDKATIPTTNPVTIDLLGNSRYSQVDGVETLSPDMGCYEYILPEGAIACHVASDVTMGHGSLTTIVTASIDGENLGSNYSYRWFVDGNQVADATGNSVELSFDTKGRYAVKVLVVDNDTPPQKKLPNRSRSSCAWVPQNFTATRPATACGPTIRRQRRRTMSARFWRVPRLSRACRRKSRSMRASTRSQANTPRSTM